MAYQLKSVTIRTNNSDEGMKQIGEIWADVVSGKLPILFDSHSGFRPGVTPVSQYSNYQRDETGDYDLSILGVTADFFQEMETAVAAGRYQRYEEAAADLGTCAKMAWEKVWKDQEAGRINRAFTRDYESTVPAEHTHDGKAHCCLFIAIAS